MSTTEDFLGGHCLGDNHNGVAAEEQAHRGDSANVSHRPSAPVTNSPDGQGHRVAHVFPAVGGLTPQAGAIDVSIPRNAAPRLADPLLALLADVLDDLERTRIANENRLRQLTRTEADSDGELRGFGLPADMPQVAALTATVEGIGKLEREAELNLKRALRRHPLGPWIKATNGVGEKQGARLLAAIGDPYWNTLHDRPRTVSELWAYCGLHVLPAASHRFFDAHKSGGGSKAHPDHTRDDTQPKVAGVVDRGDPGQGFADSQSGSAGVAPTRARGQHANWSAAAKMRAYLVAVSCMKTPTSPYRALYEDSRAKYADAIHQIDCRRCGPAGKPALAGTPISLGHQHARALRIVMKAVLKDLWLQARDIHDKFEAGAAEGTHDVRNGRDTLLAPYLGTAVNNA